MATITKTGRAPTLDTLAALAAPAAAAPAAVAVDVLADFKVSVARAPRYREVGSRASVPAISPAAYTVRGVQISDNAPMLLVVDGSKTSALPLCAIGAAIAHC